jgi:hypothetical protein
MIVSSNLFNGYEKEWLRADLRGAHVIVEGGFIFGLLEVEYCD